MNGLENWVVAPNVAAPKPRRPIFLWVLLSILGAMVILGAFLAFDPFEWHVVGLVKVLLGIGGDPVAASMPAKTSMYMGVNLLNATPDKLNRLVKPFAGALGTSTKDANGSIDDLDQQLSDALGLTLTDDIMPWIGKTAGLAMMDVQIGKSGPTGAGFVLSVQSRDNKKADAFIQKLKEALAEKGGTKLTENTYQGLTIISLKSGSSGFGDGIAFARSEDVVLFSLSEAGIMDAVNAQKGESLAKDKNYQALMDQLPKDSFVSIYMPMQKIKDLLLALMDANFSGGLYGLPTGQSKQIITEQYGKFSAIAASLAIVDAGLQMDTVVAYQLDKLTNLEKEQLKQGKNSLKSVEMLPADTLLYFGANTLKETWTTLRDSYIKMYGITLAEYDEAMQQLEKQIQVNPDKDLFPYLGGDVLIVVRPSSRGILPVQSKINLGAALMVGTTDPAKTMLAADKVSAALSKGLKSPLPLNDVNGLKYYNLKDTASNTEFVTFGVGKQYLLVGTSADFLESLFAGGQPGLPGSGRYQTAAKALPGDSVPVFYLDLEGLLGYVRAGQPKTSLQSFDNSVKVLKPVPYVIGGNSYPSDNLVKSTVVIFVTPAK